MSTAADVEYVGMGAAEARALTDQIKTGVEALSVILRALNYRFAGKPWRAVRVNSPGANGGRIPIPPVAS